MQPVQTPIIGQEGQGGLSSPFYALVQFYHAFNNRNMTVMAENWAQSDEIAMDNPLGGIKRGWAEIRQVYRGFSTGRPPCMSNVTTTRSTRPARCSMPWGANAAPSEWVVMRSCLQSGPLACFRN